MKTRVSLWWIVFAFMAGNAALSQAISQQVPTPAWGTTADIALRIPAAAFFPWKGVAIYGSNGSGERYRVSNATGATDVAFEAPVNLPAGAKVMALRVDYCDTDATYDVGGGLMRTDEPSGANLVWWPPSFLVSSGAPGCASMTANLSGNNIVIDNLNHSYWVRIGLNVVDSTNLLRGAVVFYRLQISPDPATATFTDVPVGHPLHRFVEALVAAGITGGCGGGNYCPDAPITRGQMAVFLSGALGLHWPN